MKGVVAVLLAVLAIGVLVVIGLSAQGPSGPPGANLAGGGSNTGSNPLNPAATSSVVVTVTAQLYSALAPGTAFGSSAAFVYSAEVNGAVTAFSSATQPTGSVAASVASSSGWLYTLTGRIPLVIGALCSTPSTCAGVAENLTVVFHLSLTNYFGTTNPRNTTVQFSNIAVYNVVPAYNATAPASGSFYFQFYGAFTAVAVVASAALVAMWPKIWTILPLVVLLVLLFAEFLVWSGATATAAMLGLGFVGVG